MISGMGLRVMHTENLWTWWHSSEVCYDTAVTTASAVLQNWNKTLSILSHRSPQTPY